jgi:hypothetical protein
VVARTIDATAIIYQRDEMASDLEQIVTTAGTRATASGCSTSCSARNRARRRSTSGVADESGRFASSRGTTRRPARR